MLVEVIPMITFITMIKFSADFMYHLTRTFRSAWSWIKVYMICKNFQRDCWFSLSEQGLYHDIKNKQDPFESKKVSFSKTYLTMKQSILLNRIQFAKQSSGRHPEIAIREFTGNVGVIEDSFCIGNTNQNSRKMSSMSSHRGQTFWRQHVMVKFLLPTVMNLR